MLSHKRQMGRETNRQNQSLQATQACPRHLSSSFEKENYKMNLVTIGIGLLIFLYGLYTMILRIKSPDKLGKLKAMKDKFGDNTGNILHIIAYTVLPIIFGTILIFAGLNGLSILEFLYNR